MSKFDAETCHVSQKGFATLPAIGTIPAVVQPQGSLNDLSSRALGCTSKRTHLLFEGDLIAGTVDIACERAHMLSAVWNDERKAEKELIVCDHWPFPVSQLSLSASTGTIYS